MQASNLPSCGTSRRWVEDVEDEPEWLVIYAGEHELEDTKDEGTKGGGTKDGGTGGAGTVGGHPVKVKVKDGFNVTLSFLMVILVIMKICRNRRSNSCWKQHKICFRRIHQFVRMWGMTSDIKSRRIIHSWITISSQMRKIWEMKK
jgi:hypothetical protein